MEDRLQAATKDLGVPAGEPESVARREPRQPEVKRSRGVGQRPSAAKDVAPTPALAAPAAAVGGVEVGDGAQGRLGDVEKESAGDTKDDIPVAKLNKTKRGEKEKARKRDMLMVPKAANCSGLAV